MKTTIGLDEMKNVRGGLAGVLLVAYGALIISAVVAWASTADKAGVDFNDPSALS
ncbi:hypothetical protein BTHERMOSOX_692 [Bathymodiolus thermophilus thioautotrophic gill symbiont]|uniref:Uncharacterized protein n=1 Tax=Bathymodiolus thermophilus thioautotrophic gill symbiont TaxID=2360 RepID=A0A3G3IK43_9GAMM|nr:hypothetical protein [Bathymodiolus thermophilus thioautotrophic gill symbiont]AYQ56099.1 hypothetical protein MS2017_0353 [Bathymodiolus thermophilus thioautotrophic gill symbiont]CAB5494653.1 hypothetical protein THERMOT_147 [Bathymodiolus thermophilus thioautotrophic gill symbiont]CAB5502025.1 hypothetical protein THERMOS_1508 [Bathymodiolus thermophilus thioautotrophic gill symbiont]SHA00275.1 hypothetical protein BTHERMOSOX_692 [Bathymodiolus thermophilus thioautotrophic gill symbiont]